jgi:hypothetical protein
MKRMLNISCSITAINQEKSRATTQSRPHYGLSGHARSRKQTPSKNGKADIETTERGATVGTKRRKGIGGT